MSTTGDGTSGASETAVQQAAGLLGSEVREGYAEIGDVRLHYVEAGEGPLIILLHGFPEFWYDAQPPYTPEETERYIAAWSQPGAATGMINYCRNAARQSPKHVEAQIRPISAPTLVIWGQDDRYLGQDLAEPDHDDVPGLDRVERLPGASHWVHHDEHERVNQLLVDFFAPALPAKNPAR
jgi:pimeloyl-ACP methyl ester carboxylesterase